MPYTQKGKKAKRNKKKTKKQNGGDGGLKDPVFISPMKSQKSKGANDVTVEDANYGPGEVVYEYVEGSSTIKPFLSKPPFTNSLEELQSEDIEEIPKNQKDIFLDSVTEISKEIGKVVETNEPIINKLTLTITDTPKFIDSHLFSNVATVEVQLNNPKKKPLEIETPLETKEETSELIRPAPPKTEIEFATLFPNEKKKLNGKINLEDPETFAILGAHLPFNFFEAVFSSNTLKKVTLKHDKFKPQTIKIDDIDFEFAKGEASE